MSNVFKGRSLNIIEDFSIEERRYLFKKVMELKKAFEKLRERDSELIRMHHVDGISIRAIAEDMGLSENAVKIALFRARGNMLRLLKEQEV